VLWAVGGSGTILKSTDGGSTWANAAAWLDLSGIDLYDVEAISKVRRGFYLHLKLLK
jgi:photosystem II stability/assembly factor-like uncharacterized protein